MVSPNTKEVHVPQHSYAYLVKTEVPDQHVSEYTVKMKTNG